MAEVLDLASAIKIQIALQTKCTNPFLEFTVLSETFLDLYNLPLSFTFRALGPRTEKCAVTHVQYTHIK